MLNIDPLNSFKNWTPPSVSGAIESVRARCAAIAKYVFGEKEELSPQLLNRVIQDKRVEHEMINDLEGDELLERIDFIKKDYFHKNMNSTSVNGDNLEGNSFVNSIYSMLKSLKKYNEQYPNEKNDILIKNLEETYELALEDDALRIGRKLNYDVGGRAQEYEKKIQSKLCALEPSQSIILPGGTEGHAILYQFSCRLDDNGNKVFDFSMYNGGEGVGHHYSNDALASINPWAKYQTYMIEGINPDSITDLDFINSLHNAEFEGGSLKYTIPIVGTIFNALSSLFAVNRLYKHVERSLVEKGGGTKIRTDDKKFHHKPFNYGICSWKVLTFWARENLDEETYRKFKVDMTEKSIEAYEAALKLEKQSDKNEPFEPLHLLKLSSIWSRFKNCFSTASTTDQMLDLGKGVLKKRKEKANTYLS